MICCSASLPLHVTRLSGRVLDVRQVGGPSTSPTLHGLAWNNYQTRRRARISKDASRFGLARCKEDKASQAMPSERSCDEGRQALEESEWGIHGMERAL